MDIVPERTALNVGRVYNIDDAVRLVVQQKAAGYNLLAGICLLYTSTHVRAAHPALPR